MCVEFLSGNFAGKGYIERVKKENKSKGIVFKNYADSYIVTYDKKKVLMAK